MKYLAKLTNIYHDTPRLMPSYLAFNGYLLVSAKIRDKRDCNTCLKKTLKGRTYCILGGNNRVSGMSKAVLSFNLI